MKLAIRLPHSPLVLTAFLTGATLLSAGSAHAMCGQPPLVIACPLSECDEVLGTNEPAVSISGNRTYCVLPGTTSDVGSLSISGGTLRVCGAMTLGEFTHTVPATIDLTTIAIAPGGSLDLGPAAPFEMNGFFQINNRGTLRSARDLEATTPLLGGNYIRNSGRLDFAGHSIHMASNRMSLVNKDGGTMTVGTIDIEPSPNGIQEVCLEHGSANEVDTLIGKHENFINTGSSGTADLTVKMAVDLRAIQSATNINSPNEVRVCVANGATVTHAPGAVSSWGTAIVSLNCSPVTGLSDEGQWTEGVRIAPPGAYESGALVLGLTEPNQLEHAAIRVTNEVGQSYSISDFHSTGAMEERIYGSSLRGVVTVEVKPRGRARYRLRGIVQ